MAFNSNSYSQTTMAELFQKSLGIREDGRCHRHPDVLIMEQGSSCLGSCHFCAMEKQNEIRDETTTTMSNSFFWSSAASLSLTSSFRQANGKKHPQQKQQSSPPGKGAHPQQATGEENSERQQQQRFFQSLVARWVQVQDGNLQQSIALSAPLILHELRKLEAKVNSQEKTIQEQKKTIEELKQTVETQHNSTQELLKTILQTVTSNNGNSDNDHGHMNNGKKKEMESDFESVKVSAPPTRGSNRRRPSMNSARSIDSGIKHPPTRHDSSRSFTINDLKVVSPQESKKTSKNFSASQPILYSTPLPAAEMKKLLSASQNQLSLNTDIALRGSEHSVERKDFLPDMADLFEEGLGGDLASVKKKKFQIPAHYGKKPVPTSKPMEIILERSEKPSDQIKLLPSSPQEMGMEMGDSLKGNARVFVANSPQARAAKPKVQLQPSQKELVAKAVDVKLSSVTLDAASMASELSSSASDEEEEEEEATASWFGDDDPSGFSDLRNVTRYSMLDMYGDRGTYTGTLGPDNDPTGFGTMKYESGRFYKGEWKKGRWNGKGTLLNANGDSYQGDFVSDARHGKGIYRFTSGDVYEGDFYEDNRHGKGKFKFHNGSVYTGDFCMGSFEGFGRYDFEGGFYEGMWRRDEYYGKGRLQYKDGSKYNGNFKRGSAHGFGEERLSDGTVRCGLWKRGEFLQECTKEESKKLEAKGGRSSWG